MAILNKGKTFTNGELVTPQKLHELVDLGTVSGIVNADIANTAAIADTKLATISTAGKVANSATTATNANTANAIVTRDASGNFSAGTITANLTGNVTGNLTGTASAIAENAVTSGKIADGNVTTAKLADSAVTSAKIADGTIVNADIANTAAIALSKLATGALPTAITVASANIVDGSIVNADIANTAAIADTKLATISTAGKVANSATTATNANTANAIVTRDASGNFSAGTITANSFRARGGQPGSAGISNNGFSFGAPGDNDSGMFSSADGQVEFFVNSTEKARFTNTDFLIGATVEIHPVAGVTDGVLISHFDPRIIVSRNNLPSMECRRRSSNGEIVNFYRDTTKVGNISVTSTSTAYNTSSDYRLKTNLEPLTNAVARLLQIPVYRFNWLADPDAPKVDGFLAHEAQAVVPESVTGHKDEVDAESKPIHQGIDQSKLVPLLVAAVQELAARVAALEAR